MEYSTFWQNQVRSSRAEIKRTEISTCAEKTDQQLVELVLSGEKVAFEEIFERYKRLSASVAGYYFQRPEQIEEIIQISFSKVYFELQNFQGKNEFSLAAWIKRITSNACLDTLRQKKRKPENLSCELSDNEIETLYANTQPDKKTIEDFLVEKDLAEKILRHLRGEDRAILRMYYEEGMSVSEIAEITGWSCSKIKIRTYRSRRALRKLLKKYL
jgi:RNA polymerase sigma-70 factor (ECF subfamily)